MTPTVIRFDRARVERLLHGAVSVAMPATVLRVHGPGTLECLQGVLTNDVVSPGPDRLVYAALLTPKGMIMVDFWVIIGGTSEVLLVSGPEGREPALAAFRRSLPPRLARVDDLSESWAVRWLYGDLIDAALTEVHHAVTFDRAGRASRFSVLGTEVHLASGTEVAPFAALVTGPAETVEQHTTLLADKGVTPGTADDYHAARILSGWPALGIEIGDKTLPQEVRFESIDGVSYTKGCFIGQETVARVHFRGRTQKELRGIDWSDLGPLDGNEIVTGDRALGQVQSVLVLPDRRIGLGMVRREADVGDTITAGGRAATIVPLPFDPPDRVA